MSVWTWVRDRLEDLVIMLNPYEGFKDLVHEMKQEAVLQAFLEQQLRNRQLTEQLLGPPADDGEEYEEEEQPQAPRPRITQQQPKQLGNGQQQKPGGPAGIPHRGRG